jgi:hypothetical protein
MMGGSAFILLKAGRPRPERGRKARNRLKSVSPDCQKF